MRRLVAMGLLTLPMTWWACEDGKTEARPARYDQKKLLTTIANQVVLPVYHDAETSAVVLSKALAIYSDTLESGVTDAVNQRLDAQNAFRKAMGFWQRAEVFQLGPAGPVGKVAGGEAIRDRIYAWPTIIECRIDQEIVAKKYTNPAFFNDALVSVMGFGALEYLLFYDGAANACAPQVDINQGPWQALSTEEIAKRRAGYGKAIAARLVKDISSLHSTWEKSWATKLASAQAPYENADQAVDDLLTAIFYIEFKVKDAKVATPLGLRDDCGNSCSDKLESRRSALSKENIIENLVAFRMALTGSSENESGYGFSAALKDAGAASLGADMEKDTESAIRAFQSIAVSLEAALADNPASMKTAYNALKKVTDNLKGRFVTVLKLQIPLEAGGDND